MVNGIVFWDEATDHIRRADTICDTNRQMTRNSGKCRPWRLRKRAIRNCVLAGEIGRIGPNEIQQIQPMFIDLHC